MARWPIAVDDRIFLGVDYAQARFLMRSLAKTCDQIPSVRFR
jgi:hypothetical protein